MRYLALKTEFALQTLHALRAGEHVSEETVLELRGMGDDVELLVPALCRTLEEIRSRYPEELGRRDPAGGAFEAEACVEVHRSLPNDPEMLADYEWWTWLAVFHFRDLVDWRHGTTDRGAAPRNFGIGNGSENLLYRMWLRADIAFDPGLEDPYEMARLGDQDFWRSHVFRQSYGRCRTLVRALARYQFSAGGGESPRLKTREVRELAKRLRRLHHNVMFECLDTEAAYRLVSSEAALAKASLERGSA